MTPSPGVFGPFPRSLSFLFFVNHVIFFLRASKGLYNLLQVVSGFVCTEYLTLGVT